MSLTLTPRNDLGDFVVIIGSQIGTQNVPVQVEQTPGGTSFDLPERFNFDTGGRVQLQPPPGAAFLLCSVRRLTQGADILINGREAGHITGTPRGDLPGGDFDVHLIPIDDAVLSGARGKNNRISFKNVRAPFVITTLACFFQQAP